MSQDFFPIAFMEEVVKRGRIKLNGPVFARRYGINRFSPFGVNQGIARTLQNKERDHYAIKMLLNTLVRQK